jgi:hypothetical protein
MRGRTPLLTAAAGEKTGPCVPPKDKVTVSWSWRDSICVATEAELARFLRFPVDRLIWVISKTLRHKSYFFI